MTKKRIKFTTILNNQLPSYVGEDFPLVVDFLKQYYLSQEFQGSSVDLIQNIDRYIKLDEIKSQAESVTLLNDISFSDDVIFVESLSGTLGFPDSYGLIKIDDEIITYVSKTNNSFIGCIRGFSGISSYTKENSLDELVFAETESADHLSGSKITNLSSLFLKEFLKKIKYQLIPGFEGRTLDENLDQYLFLKQSKDFYSTKGTDTSFKILFKVLYGENVDIIKPQNYLVRPSDARYRVANDLVVESIEGNPYNLINSTLFQDEYLDMSRGYAPISDVEKIYSIDGKEYYRLSFDSGYNKDINVEGSLYGSFYIHPKTKLIGDVDPQSTTLDVDSTVGFPSEGELSVIYEDSTIGTVLYTSKNLNQFFGCSNIEKKILDTSNISLNIFAYGKSNQNTDETIKVRVTSVLKDIDIVDELYYQYTGDSGIIRTLGVNPSDPASNNWIFNIPINLDVKSISLVDSLNKIYKITTFVKHHLKIGDFIDITDNLQVKNKLNVVDVISESEFLIGRQVQLSTSLSYQIQRSLTKVDHSYYQNLSNLNANIQNVYKIKDKTLVASSSLPFYNNQPLKAFDRSVVFSGIFSGDTFKITSEKDHGFYTGDAIYYLPSQQTEQPLFNEGVYFIKRVDLNQVKFGKSRSDIYQSKFITVEDTVNIISDTIILQELKSKSLKSQNLLREINPPINDGKDYLTNPGPIGMLINGTEILNYKAKDQIYYGKIENIDVTFGGNNYDIIDPPILDILDPVGFGATGYCAVSGSLLEIRIIDSGFDYINAPKINITGGNGKGAKAFPIMKLVDHEISFDSEQKSGQVSIVNNTIGFSTYHKFRNAEKVIYKTNNQKSIGGISTNSTYYLHVIGNDTVTVHSNYNDSAIGINTIPLLSFGTGNHSFKSFNKKSVISSINISNSGNNYENKKRTATPVGINTSINVIQIKDHGFNSGEIVKYSSNDQVIGGLNNNQNYYLTKIDNDNFKLSLIDVGNSNEDFYYKTNQYVDLTFIGTGTHYFNYPPISVDIIGEVGISSTVDSDFKAKVQPIFRGEITSFHLSNGGNFYGNSEILNYYKEPLLLLREGKDCELMPIVNNGKIVEVLVNRSGSNYNSSPDIEIQGSGIGAVLVPIVENGQIKEVKIIEGGFGYDQNNTSLSVFYSGTAAKFSAKLQSWTVNLVRKYLNSIQSDDGFVFYNSYTKGDLQYSHLYAPRKLRESVYSVNSLGKEIYGNFDLIKLSEKEVSSTKHSPIIGWSYDGNPIYGPYGYTNKNAENGSTISQMKSGYKLSASVDQNRPSQYPAGFFIEDFVYYTSEDDTVLDKYNGRFCVTPEFPNGTYAYFSTFESTVTTELSNPFNNYKSPAFPYLIGNWFKSQPNEFNFKVSSNQEDIDLNKTNWTRNTKYYNLLEEKTLYKYINTPNKLNQKVDIKYSAPGSVENVGIITGGNGYKINDLVISDSEETKGYGFSAKVSKLKGKEVKSIILENIISYDAEIYPDTGKKDVFNILTTSPHNFSSGDIVSISGFNTSILLFNDFYFVGVSTNTLSISNPSGVGTVGATGIVTYISVRGNLPKVRENDIFSIGSEKVKILNVDLVSSRVKVLREYDSTVGTSHSYSNILYESSRKLFISSKVDIPYTYRTNKELYFDPKESVAIGTNFGVGIGTTISFSNPGAGITQIFIPTKSIYLPKHGLETGDELIYSVNGGNSIGISTDGVDFSKTLSNQSIVYAAKISNDLIGISTFAVGIGSTGTIVGISSENKLKSTLYFTSHGSGNYHSFKTKLNSLKGNITKNKVTVSTAETHGLLDNDIVFIDVNSGISTTIKVVYDDYNRKLLINPRSFSSVGVNTSGNTISIVNHGFITGQQVIHNSSSSVLQNNKDYYVVVVDKDTVKLSDTYNKSIQIDPQTVGISSAFNGTLSLVNPPITVNNKSTVFFDLSDPSLSYSAFDSRYSAFNFNFYSDQNFINLFESSKNEKLFEVKKYGTVGITSNAKVSLTVNKNTPKKLYYKLDPIYNPSLPQFKSEISVDSSVYSYNELNIEESLYNGRHSVISTSSTSFTYSLRKNPEVNYYDPSLATLGYETISDNADGPVSKIDIVSRGQNYLSLPQFLEISSESGNGALLEYSSKNIGKIKKLKINDIGFDFSCDFTLKPNLSLPQILKIEPLSSIDSIQITSVGSGYNVAPKLVILDGTTKTLMSEIDIEYSLGDNYVTILKNTYGITNVPPIIIPIQNSNGVGISSIGYDVTTNNVTVTLAVGFSTANTFPFEVNDRVLIENISVGINSTGKGFDSKNYNYELFTITAVSENLGGIGIVTYSLNNLLSPDELPGTYDPINSSGRIIPEKYFPKFKSTLKKNQYLIDEKVKYLDEKNTIGIVEGFDSKNDYARIVSKEYLNPGKILQGETSKTQGFISSVVSGDAFINLAPYSKFENGWQTEVGFLGNNLQKIQDSFYYQNFSYSLKSKVSYDTWEDAVGSLNHTLGFKKFSDYQCEPSLLEVTNNSLFAGSLSGVSTNRIDTSIDLIGIGNLNCSYDFDLARENVLINDNKVSSNEIYFSSKILTDYYESVSNRVLAIDDFSESFYNLPRTTRYSIAHEFDVSTIKSQKYITFVKDRRYIGQKQLSLVTLICDSDTGYLNQYGRVETSYDLGSFDISIENPNKGLLLFYPNKSLWNDYDVTTLAYNINDNFVGISSTSFGNIVYVNKKTNYVSSGSTTIIGIGTTFTSVKAIVEIIGSNDQREFNEINLIHDGTDIEYLDYGQLITDSSSISNPLSNLGTFDAYISGSQVNVDFTVNPEISATINSIQISIANTESSGIGTHDLQYSKIEAKSTSISSSSSPTSSVISEYPDVYNGGYFIVQITDKTNNVYQLSEVIVVNDLADSYDTEFAVLRTGSSIGNISSLKVTNSTQLLFTPNPDIDVEIKVYSNFMRDYRDDTKQLSLFDGTLVNDYQIYYGAAVDVKRSFDLNHKGYPIFKRYFNGSSPSFVDIDNNVIIIENHFFVTGENVEYSSGVISESNSPIGISTTDFGPGIGTTDKLPSSVYIVKIDQNRIKLANNVENALKFVPETLNLTSVGLGTNHTFTSVNKNARGIITIDNVIQSPVVSTATTTYLVSQNLKSDDILYFNDYKEFFSGDLVKIDEEIMRIDSVGVGSTNAIRVNRPWLGSIIDEHSSSAKVTKIIGDYNIVDNKINFVTAPYGQVPIGTSTNPPDERDWEDISTNSTFYGRIFMRSGLINGTYETYYKNYIFDDISHQFNGTTNQFTLKSNGGDISDISPGNAVVLINDIFQEPGINASYTLEETVGITSIKFIGAGTSLASDINTSNLPIGGLIVSVGSTSGFGYQPLISAGGTAIVSTSGTISSISIGNSGSGYRQKVQDIYQNKDVTIRVGVTTLSIEDSNIYFIGTAFVTNGNIVSVAITNPGTGFTSTNPPRVIFDSPLSYSDIPLIYSSSSSGVGTQATIDIVVGQGSSVIDFEIKNLGYGYKPGDILTISTDSIVGIPTVKDSTFEEFQVQIQKTFVDKFVGWSIGELQLLDKIESLFTGKRAIFPLKYQGQLISILSAKGSNIDIKDNLLIFINDILQVPNQAYIFNGGSSIKFNDAPREGDTCKIFFYKGSGDIDVPFKNILETVKIGDELKLTYDSSIGQRPDLLEDPRTVLDIKSIDLVETNPYFGPGNTSDETLIRPIVWCKQTEDKLINQKEVGKDRILYEASIYPSAYIINSVGIGSTIVFVDNIRPFFNPINENIGSLEFQKNIYLISQDVSIGAAATAVVSIAGTISSINISEGGYGYDTAPEVTIQNPIGIGTTRSLCQSYISSGIVTSIIITESVSGYSQSNPPLVLIESPSVKIEKNKIKSYLGDFGIITGIATTSVGIASTGIIFDFMIPSDSPLRNASITGFTSVSGIGTDYYFVISDSNIGNGVTSLSKNGEVVGIGNSFLDGVYQAANVTIEQSLIIGIGVTYIARVTTSVSDLNGLTGIGISNYYGRFSWGRIQLEFRQKENAYNSYTLNGYSGISTSSILKRENPLKYSEYKNPP